MHQIMKYMECSVKRELKFDALNDQVSVHQVILWKMDTSDKKLRARC